MRTYKFWLRVPGTIRVAGQAQEVHCLAGSNESLEAAAQAGRERIAAIQRKIDGHPDGFAEYDAEIREEVIGELDAQNVITRNRYGALVLNSAQTMFIDIDRPVLSWWEVLFPWLAKGDGKERILAQVRRNAARHPGLTFRVYETQKGIRLLVLGRFFEADSSAAQELMRSFHADRLYALLCRKQKCFRARLTPKPHRMHCRTRKIFFPRERAEEQADHVAWVAEYEACCAGFATCRYLESLGETPSGPEPALVQFHDEATKAHSAARLA